MLLEVQESNVIRLFVVRLPFFAFGPCLTRFTFFIFSVAGGLLMGNMYTMRPDLFGAIHCAVPLLDMKRFHTLLAGASWMAEYGNPDTDDWNNFL
jgi:protease II